MLLSHNETTHSKRGFDLYFEEATWTRINIYRRLLFTVNFPRTKKFVYEIDDLQFRLACELLPSSQVLLAPANWWSVIIRHKRSRLGNSKNAQPEKKMPQEDFGDDKDVWQSKRKTRILIQTDAVMSSVILGGSRLASGFTRLSSPMNRFREVP